MDLMPKTNQTFTHHHNSSTSFPILAIAIIGILTTALLLITYYIFVIKCCLNFHRIDILSRFSNSRRRDPQSQPEIQTRGLDNSTIQSIPVIRYKKGEKRVLSRDRSFEECVVCLNEFLEEEKLRAIPNCAHLFHVDCIDVWLQKNENCPLCRNSISISISQLNYPQVASSSSSSQNDEDYVVIELGDPTAIRPNIREKRGKLSNNVLSMGDECIDSRGKDDHFNIQPIRRSFSMDSANDRQLYLSIRAIIEKNNKNGNEDGLMSESSSGRVKRGLFSFGSGKGSSRNAILPIEYEL